MICFLIAAIVNLFLSRRLLYIMGCLEIRMSEEEYWLLYAAVKLTAYVLWCLVGLYIFGRRPSVVGAIKFGVIRWCLGLGLGIAAALALGSISQNNVAALYFGVYIPLRIVEWSIMVALIDRRQLALQTLRSSPRAWLWILGGIAVSFASDLASPAGMDGRFCVGRCLC
jgi:hypothetical protein